jgi:diguanylate cyclase (GGDEF)-like protein/PAS domain S-box-containing protein
MWFDRRERPFVFWLVVVQLASVLPLLAFATLLTYRLIAANEDEAINRLQQKVSVAADAMAREVDRVRLRLELLATQESALRGDVAEVRKLADRIVAIDGSIAAASALDRTGQLVFSTRLPAGTPLPPPRRPLPPGVAPVFERGETYISPLTPGGLENVVVIGYAVPWRVDGEIRYSLRMSIKPTALGDLLREQRWSPSWTAALLDQKMNIVARSRDEAQYFGKPATDSLQQVIANRGAGIGFSTTKEGTEVVTAVAQVPGTPWWLVAGLPRADLQQQASGPIRQLLIGGAVLVALGVVSSIALGRRLNQSLQAAASGRSDSLSEVSEFRFVEIQRLMLENDLIGMVRLKDRKAVWHNQALERIFGYAPGELDGHSPRLMHTDDASFANFGKDSNAVLSAGKPYRAQLEMVRKDRARIWVDVSGVQLSSGETMWIVMDISALKAEQARVEQLAFRDHLTGLPNRALLVDRLEQALETLQRTGDSLAVCFIDLNGFKAVNDTHGHAAGDTLLKVIAGRLQDCVRPQDTVARLGGDEFVVLLNPLAHVREVDAILARVRQTVALAVDVPGAQCSVTAAMGVAYCPEDGTDAQALLVVADRRMYADKQEINPGERA